MKQLTILLCSFLLMASAMSQTPTQTTLAFDSTYLKKTTGAGNAELILMNGTRNVVGGFLRNKGNGRTEFAPSADSSIVTKDYVADANHTQDFASYNQVWNNLGEFDRHYVDGTDNQGVYQYATGTEWVINSGTEHSDLYNDTYGWYIEKVSNDPGVSYDEVYNEKATNAGYTSTNNEQQSNLESTGQRSQLQISSQTNPQSTLWENYGVTQSDDGSVYELTDVRAVSGSALGGGTGFSVSTFSHVSPTEDEGVNFYLSGKTFSLNIGGSYDANKFTSPYGDSLDVIINNLPPASGHLGLMPIMIDWFGGKVYRGIPEYTPVSNIDPAMQKNSMWMDDDYIYYRNTLGIIRRAALTTF